VETAASVRIFLRVSKSVIRSPVSGVGYAITSL
jgi:hypothetical protein